MGGRVSTSPVAPTGKTLEAVRRAARRRFLYASVLLALGALAFGLAQSLLLASLLPVGALTALIVAVLLQVLGLAAGAYAAVIYRRSFPLSEAAGSARQALLLTAGGVLPIGIAVSVAWIALVLPGVSFLLLPVLPSFWGLLSAFSAVGLVFAAREFASERMAVLAGVGAGIVIASTVSEVLWSLVDPVQTLRSARLVVDLLLVAAGFFAVAASFEKDPWVARSRRTP